MEMIMNIFRTIGLMFGKKIEDPGVNNSDPVVRIRDRGGNRQNEHHCCGACGGNDHEMKPVNKKGE
ncbi:hypothetical protein [Micavibrio aeruginosavorus]|uniref:hypothetical protein n=1 Tax=Micavibrio aeruginosavorus TaxID=349221 RepID=UPI0011D2BBB4|nr:hypothetical protein [Micavibrio aeruginosavorus]